MQISFSIKSIKQNLKHFKSIPILVIAVALSGCVRLEDKNADERARSRGDSGHAEASGVAQNKNTEFQFVAKEEFNSYAVVLRPPAEARRFFRYQGEGVTAASQIPTIRKISEGQYQDEDVVAGRTYTYVYCRNESDSCDAIKMLQVEVPLDFEIQGEVQIQKTENWKFGRLVLRSNSRIVMKENHLSIAAQSLIAEAGASIENFSDLDEAPTNEEGADGGHLTLAAENLEGVLRIEMRGQAGGRGLDGRAWASRAQAGEDGMFAIDGKYGNNCKYTKPGDGKPGAPGDYGRSGRSGGFSGNVIFVGPPDFGKKLDIRFFNSRGGAGGAGQAGQLGGLPGKYINQPYSQSEYENTVGRCGAPPPPPQEGLQGSKGSDGSIGSSGAVGKLILK